MGGSWAGMGQTAAQLQGVFLGIAQDQVETLRGMFDSAVFFPGTDEVRSQLAWRCGAWKAVTDREREREVTAAAELRAAVGGERPPSRGEGAVAGESAVVGGRSSRVLSGGSRTTEGVGARAHDRRGSGREVANGGRDRLAPIGDERA